MSMPPPWSQLSHAFGPATDLPELLEALTPDAGDAIWGELSDRVYHQGSIYPASRHILPFLLKVAGGWKEPGRVMPLSLASSIVASPDFDSNGFEDTVEHLRILAEETARTQNISRSDCVYLMSAALTFAGDKVWGPALEGLHDEEFPGTCPACDGHLFFTIGEAGFRTATRPGDHRRQEEIAPCNGWEIGGVGAWMFGLVNDVKDAELSKRIAHLFGKTVCTNCDLEIKVHEAVARFASTV